MPLLESHSYASNNKNRISYRQNTELYHGLKFEELRLSRWMYSTALFMSRLGVGVLSFIPNDGRVLN